MAGVTWFMDGTQAHAQKAGEDPAERFVGRCGIQPKSKTMPTMEVDAQTGRSPAESCVKCLIEVGMDAMNEEPMDYALDRGYEPMREEELEERGALD